MPRSPVGLDIDQLEAYYRSYNTDQDYMLMLKQVLEERIANRPYKSYPRQRALLAQTNARLVELAAKQEGEVEPEEAAASVETHTFLQTHPGARLTEWHRVMLNTQRQFGLATAPPPTMNTTGTGPYEEADFDTYLRQQGHTVTLFNADFEVLVVGRSISTEESVIGLIQSRGGKKLKVYSQEMMAAWLSCGKDPYDAPEIMQHFRAGHPVLEWLSELEEYDWEQGVSLAAPDFSALFYEMVKDRRIIEWHDRWINEHAMRGGSTTPPIEVLAVGSSPLEADEIESLLGQWEISTAQENPDLDHLVLGRSGWTEDKLLEIAVSRENGRLWVYSQEMMVAWLSCGRDPFLDSDILDIFLRDHNGLRWFNSLPKGVWTQGVLTPRSGLAQEDIPRNPTGLLSEIGYHVGKTKGLRREDRRQLLAEFMEGTRHSNLGRIGDTIDFGAARSGTRLECLEKRIAHQIFEKRANMDQTGIDFRVAIQDWQEDLDWLYAKYYRAFGCIFRWKDGKVNPW